MINAVTSLVVLTFAVLAVLDVRSHARRFPTIPRWRAKGVFFFLLTVAVSSAAPLLWDAWLAEHQLVDASGLGHVGGAIVGFLGLQLGIYAWHRTLHRVPFLFRWFHQMHHSAERVDVFGAFYFHPLDTAAFALVGSLAVVLVLGVTAPAALAASFLASFCSLFQHANLRTPRWLGYLIQRPESHSIHHQRGIHAFNYGDIALWDIVFGTFRNPETFEAQAGYYDGASRRVAAMLLGRDVTSGATDAPALPASQSVDA
jgi:sterol desaturase/sphingolipid hydroxylase (fatty acid hydroxylase superfamily)